MTVFYFFLYLLVSAIFTIGLLGYNYDENDWSLGYVREELETEKMSSLVLFIGGWFFVTSVIIYCRLQERYSSNPNCRVCHRLPSRCSCATIG